jgi:intraflagellar transport protein 122
VDGLVDICRLIDKTDNIENLQLCAYHFRRLKFHPGAKEAYLKLGDLKSLMALHVEFLKWDEAFLLGK